MTKSIEILTELIDTPNRALRRVGFRGVKAQQHRYERRKTKEYIKLRDWRDDLV